MKASISKGVYNQIMCFSEPMFKISMHLNVNKSFSDKPPDRTLYHSHFMYTVVCRKITFCHCFDYF